MIDFSWLFIDIEIIISEITTNCPQLMHQQRQQHYGAFLVCLYNAVKYVYYSITKAYIDSLMQSTYCNTERLEKEKRHVVLT
jgi:hypothetical protein